MSDVLEVDRPFVYEACTQVNVRYKGKNEVVAVITEDMGRYRLEQTLGKGFVPHELRTLAQTVLHTEAVAGCSTKAMAGFQAEMHEAFYKNMDQDAVEQA